MNFKNTSLLFLIILSPVIVSAQKYLSKAAPEIEMEWKDHTFSSTKTFAENIGQASEFATLSKILKDKALMSSVVKFLTIPGRIDKNGLQVAVKKHDGKASLATLNGEYLDITQKDDQLFLVDSQGKMAAITATNFYHKNGLFHIVDRLVFPTPNE